MGITSSKADTAPPPMPNFSKGTSPVVQQALKDLKEVSCFFIERKHHAFAIISDVIA